MNKQLQDSFGGCFSHSGHTNVWGITLKTDLLIVRVNYSHNGTT
jgi:hypothetical protein